jgi:hypothetical protein
MTREQCVGLLPDFLYLRTGNAMIDDLEETPGFARFGNLIDRRQCGAARGVAKDLGHIDNGNLRYH